MGTNGVTTIANLALDDTFVLKRFIDFREIRSHKPTETSVGSLNSTASIITFNIGNSRGGRNLYCLYSDYSGFRVKYRFAVGKSAIRNAGQTTPTWGAANINSVKDALVTLQSAFFGRIFSSMGLNLNNTQLEIINPVYTWFHLRNQTYGTVM